MRICDITLRDIQAGKNWRFTPPEGDSWIDLPMEEWGPLVEATDFLPEDRIVYSGLTAYADGTVKALVCLREVHYLDYGGDYCEFVDGAWRQLGLKPNPNAPLGQTYIANPLSIDPSFEAPDHDYRKQHRDGFKVHAYKLTKSA